MTKDEKSKFLREKVYYTARCVKLIRERKEGEIAKMIEEKGLNEAYAHMTRGGTPKWPPKYPTQRV